jgi:hypothetical protein
MLHRLAAMLIVIFWMCMTGLLVVREMYPEVTRLNHVPTSMVTHIIFQHQQPSDLQIYEGTKEIGFLHVQPRRVAQTGAQMLDLHGTLGVDIPGGGRQRLSWDGNIEMNSAFSMQRLRLNLSFQSGTRLEILVEPPKNIARYSVKTGSHAQETAELTLDEQGFTGLLARTGISPVSLPQMKAAGAAMTPPEFTAQTSNLTLNGETVSTFFFSMKIEGQSIIEAHLSQLGQVLRAQIPLLGYKFAPQNVSP